MGRWAVRTRDPRAEGRAAAASIHAQLFFRCPGTSPRASELAAYLAMGRTACVSLFGELNALGPYR